MTVNPFLFIPAMWLTVFLCVFLFFLVFGEGSSEAAAVGGILATAGTGYVTVMVLMYGLLH